MGVALLHTFASAGQSKFPNDSSVDIYDYSCCQVILGSDLSTCVMNDLYTWVGGVIVVRWAESGPPPSKDADSCDIHTLLLLNACSLIKYAKHDKNVKFGWSL